jgi:hypothetical protein
MISYEDVEEIKRCITGTQRIGDYTPDEKLRRVLNKLCRRIKDEAYDEGYEDGRKEYE